MDKYRVKVTKPTGETALVAMVGEETKNKIKNLCSRDIVFTGDKKADMIERIADYCGVTRGDMNTSSRMADLVRARALSFYYLVKGQGMTFAAAGAYFGRDHSSVIHNIKVVEKQWMNDYKEVLALNK